MLAGAMPRPWPRPVMLGWKRVDRLHLASYQSPRGKLVGQYRRRRQTSRLTEVIFPPHSDWVANYRPSYVSATLSYPRLFLLRASTELPIEHVGSLRAGALCDTDFIACSLLNGKEWLEVKRPLLNFWTYAGMHRQTTVILV